MALSVAVIVLGTNLVLGAIFFFVAGHYAKTCRILIELNRELIRNVWAQAAAKDPSAPLAGHLANAAAGAAHQTAPRRAPDFDLESALTED